MDTDIKPVRWVGNSIDRVRGFPPEVRRDIGSALYDVQKGDTPKSAKPYHGVGSGVYEIVTDFKTNTYRTVYAVKIGAHVYVLHAFQKKSPKGRKVARTDEDLIRRRYKLALQMEKESQK